MLLLLIVAALAYLLLLLALTLTLVPELRATAWLRDPITFLLVITVLAAAAIFVVTGLVAMGSIDADLTTWDSWLGDVQKLAAIVAIAGAAYIAYLRFIGGGGVLAARCSLALKADIQTLRGNQRQRGLVVGVSITNDGNTNLDLLGPDRYPAVVVSCLSQRQIADAQGDGAYNWRVGKQLIGRPFRGPDGTLDHVDIEPRGSIHSGIALPIPEAAADGPYRAFGIRFHVWARSAKQPGRGYYWICDTVVLDEDASEQEADVHEQSSPAQPR
jgi:hypothetical protein